MAAAPGRRQPWHAGMIDDSLFALGGICEYWAKEGRKPPVNCAIIATDANALIAKIHQRVPVIIAPEHYARWLDPRLSDPGEISEMLAPYPADEMRAYTRSRPA